MNIDFTQVLFDMDGEPVEDVSQIKKPEPGKPVEKGPALTLGRACILPLTLAQKDDKGEDLKGPAKLEYYILAAQIRDALRPGAKPADLSAEQIVMLKTVVAQQYVPLVAGQAWQMLEGQTAKAEV